MNISKQKGFSGSGKSKTIEGSVASRNRITNSFPTCKKSPVILAIAAASGVIYGMKTLEFLLKEGFKVELVISSRAYYIFRQELDIELEHNREQIKKSLLDFLKLEDSVASENRNTNSLPAYYKNLTVWLDDEIWANIASGSYKTQGMIIAPASMAMLAAISAGFAENLITRAADVCLKEKRSLTIVPRETPLSSIHLENMLKLSKFGVNIVPPNHGFYGKIKTLDESIDFVAGKILDAANISNNLYERWHK